MHAHQPQQPPLRGEAACTGFFATSGAHLLTHTLPYTAAILEARLFTFDSIVDWMSSHQALTAIAASAGRHSQERAVNLISDHMYIWAMCICNRCMITCDDRKVKVGLAGLHVFLGNAQLSIRTQSHEMSLNAW